MQSLHVWYVRALTHKLNILCCRVANAFSPDHSFRLFLFIYSVLLNIVSYIRQHIDNLKIYPFNSSAPDMCNFRTPALPTGNAGFIVSRKMWYEFKCLSIYVRVALCFFNKNIKISSFLNVRFLAFSCIFSCCL